jgi:hypothetical protein
MLFALLYRRRRAAPRQARHHTGAPLDDQPGSRLLTVLWVDFTVGAAARRAAVSKGE